MDTASGFFFDGGNAGFAACTGADDTTALTCGTGFANLAVTALLADTTAMVGATGFGAGVTFAALTAGLGAATFDGLTAAFGNGLALAAEATVFVGLDDFTTTAAVLAVALGLTTCAFTDDLLAGFTCTGCAGATASTLSAWLTLAVFATTGEGFSSARECTGFDAENPISCKSETNITRPRLG